jgi:hypothetical protein
VLEGPEPRWPYWWQFFRRVVIFLLGCAVIIDALWDQKFVGAELVVGLILVGVLPIDDFVALIARRRHRDH